MGADLVAALAASFASGAIVDAILVLVAAEAAFVGLHPAIRAPRAPLLAGLAAGAGLLLALRAGLAGAGWPWIAAALSLAFAAHLTEMGLRLAGSLRRREPAATSLQTHALPMRPRAGRLPRVPAPRRERRVPSPDSGA